MSNLIRTVRLSQINGSNRDADTASFESVLGQAQLGLDLCFGHGPRFGAQSDIPHFFLFD